MNDLLPCPFCGSAPSIWVDPDFKEAAIVECINDGCSVSVVVVEESPDIATSRWNHRHSPNGPQASLFNEAAS